MEKVRCENCDAITDSDADYFDAERMDGVIRPGWWNKPHRCYHCKSCMVVRTNEPYRPPKSERMSQRTTA